VTSGTPRQGSAAESAAPSLSRTESDRRKAILGLLKEALAARRISSVLVGRRVLVLRSAQGQRSFRGGELVRAADPQLYVFAAGGADVHIVTTDGDSYWFAGGRVLAVADPGDAAQAIAGGRSRSAE
jgi:hypothetical protein